MQRDIYKKLYYLENNHWWFKGRRRIISDIIKKLFSKKEKIKILDVGCGTGSEIEFFSNFGQVIGIDSSKEAIDLCLHRGLEDKVVEANAKKLPFIDESFNLVLILDILEHIQCPNSAILEICRVLKKEGFAIFTVPAYNFLWSEHDKISGHYRRYNIKDLRSTLELKGFRTIKISYFNNFLFCFIFLLRKFKNLIRSKSTDLEIPPMFINYLLELIFSSERFFLKYFNFPFGVSVIAIIQKI